MAHLLAALAALAACPLAAPPLQSRSPVALRRVPLPSVVSRSGTEEGARAILDREGREVAVLRHGTDERSVRIRRHGSAAGFDAPAFQQWVASDDGRTLVGIGDPAAPEHPFELRFSIYTDGSLAYEAPLRLDPESAFAVGGHGRVAFVGHPVGEREQWFAALFEPEGSTYREVFRHDLPKGLQAKDPALFSGGLLLLAHEPVIAAGSRELAGEVLMLDSAGLRRLIEVPRAQQLIAFPRLAGALVRSNERLTWISVPMGRVVWRSDTVVLPAGPHAWTACRPPSGPSAPSTQATQAALAVAASDVRRRGEPTPPVVLRLFDVRTGAALSSVPLERRGPLAHLRLTSEAQHLIIDWMDAREVFGWQR